MEPHGDPHGFGRKQDFIFGDGGGSSAPAAPAVQAVDPAVGQAMLKQSETGDRVSREAEARMRRFDPLLEGAAQQQLRIGDANEKRSTAQWEDYNSLFRPAESKYVGDAMGYDTPERRELEAQKAGAMVQSQFGKSNEQAIRDLSRAGLVAPNADLINGTRGVSLARAATMAGAMNQARTRVEDTGAARVENVAKFGRGLPGTGIAADQVALSGAGAGASTLMGANAAGIAAGNAGLPGWQGAAQTGIGIANANNSANMANYNAQLGAWGQQQNANAAGAAGFGQLVGTLGGAAIQKGLFGISSKDNKEDKKPVDDGASLEMVKKLPVEKWKYKDGVADGGEHIGPYAEDVNAEMGEGAAPGGKMIDLVSMNGLALSAIKALDRKIDKLKVGLDSASRPMRQTRHAGRIA